MNLSLSIFHLTFVKSKRSECSLLSLQVKVLNIANFVSWNNKLTQCVQVMVAINFLYRTMMSASLVRHWRVLLVFKIIFFIFSVDCTWLPWLPWLPDHDKADRNETLKQTSLFEQVLGPGGNFFFLLKFQGYWFPKHQGGNIEPNYAIINFKQIWILRILNAIIM